MVYGKGNNGVSCSCGVFGVYINWVFKERKMVAGGKLPTLLEVKYVVICSESEENLKVSKGDYSKVFKQK